MNTLDWNDELLNMSAATAKKQKLTIHTFTDNKTLRIFQDFPGPSKLFPGYSWRPPIFKYKEKQ